MSEQALIFRIHEAGESREEVVTITQAVIAGWTGRDVAALEKHIKELEELGVPRPASTPIFYRVAATRLSTSDIIEVSGGESSGEIEFILVQHHGALYVGVGSDHTDRQVETYNITVSKQMCEKPVAGELWAWDEVRDHWDTLKLRSWIDNDVIYQDGSVTTMRHPDDLMALYSPSGLAEGTLMFCGTLAAIGGIRPAPHFSFELYDPELDRRIKHGYGMIELPVVG
jgi:hypothetical protein